ncbi:MAG: hypothetical protein ACRDJF_11615, partial [Actinomycetota bacterium]
MGEEVSVVLKPLDVPLNRSPLLKPETRPSWRWYEADPASFKRARRQLPIAEEGFARGLALPHPYLLGNEADMADFLAGVEKVLANLDQLMAAGRQLT